ncbi:hypothetical protein, partial [Escherichia coli]|uniref:hypothetical protein n=1 Tax=Escherichia coli TaxID=562 RepID=UPI001964DA3A
IKHSRSSFDNFVNDYTPVLTTVVILANTELSVDWSDLEVWCNAHLRGGFIAWYTRSWLFEMPQDAMMFKLRWA